jgi:NADH-quinone oxidoreductase subunit L
VALHRRRRRHRGDLHHPHLQHGERFESSVEWLRFGTFSVSLGIKYDDLAALMLFIVGFVGFLIHLFSLGYMHDDQARARFFGGLSIFMFSMIGIVLADNLFMIFIFWELVGFSSWLLINHYHGKQSAADASKKAFIVNRVGDFGFLLGIIMCYWANGTVNFTELSQLGAAQELVFSTAIPLLLFCGAMGKSAQMPLQVWLPDAMEGPTPVSALIHAATMVAAGIFMLCRINVLMVPRRLMSSCGSARSRRFTPRSAPSSSATSRRCWPTRRSRNSATWSRRSGWVPSSWSTASTRCSSPPAWAPRCST